MAAPVGTTFTLSALFARYPVRRKICLKDRKKSIAQMKVLLLAFAILYPSVRLSFSITGSNEPVLMFKESSIKEKLARVFGVKNVSHLDEGTKSLCGWVWNHVMPKEADAIKGRVEYYLVAVNGRPLTSTLPVTKKIVSHVNKRFTTQLGCKPGIWVLAISSVKAGTFDVNVEPSKDDIIFNDLNQVLEGIDRFLDDLLGVLPSGASLEILVPKVLEVEVQRPLSAICTPPSMPSSPVSQFTPIVTTFLRPPTPAPTSSPASSLSTLRAKISGLSNYQPRKQTNNARYSARIPSSPPRASRAVSRTIPVPRTPKLHSSQYSPGPSIISKISANPPRAPKKQTLIPQFFEGDSGLRLPSPFPRYARISQIPEIERPNGTVLIDTHSFAPIINNDTPHSIPVADYVAGLLGILNFAVTPEGWVLLS